jgi:hypothetical protein
MVAATKVSWPMRAVAEVVEEAIKDLPDSGPSPAARSKADELGDGDT